MTYTSDFKILTFPTVRIQRMTVPETRDWNLLDFLRTAALRARLAPHIEPERACALIAADPTISADLYAQAFFRALASTSINSLDLHHRGVRHATPDEDWLEAMIRAFQRGDDASASLILSSRTKRLGRHRMFALTSGLAKALEALDISDTNSLAS